MTAKAYQIADAGFKKLMESVVEGKREYEAAAEAEYVRRKMGAEGYGYRTIIGTAESAHVGLYLLQATGYLKMGKSF